MIYFANNIKYLRKKEKLSQGEVAEKIGKSIAVVSSYETNRAEPNISMLAEFSELFNISSDDLLFTDLTKSDGKTNADQQMKKTSLEYAQDLEAGRKTIDEVEAEVGDKNLKKIIKLLELRVNELEMAIREQNPELADKLKID